MMVLAVTFTVAAFGVELTVNQTCRGWLLRAVWTHAGLVCSHRPPGVTAFLWYPFPGSFRTPYCLRPEGFLLPCPPLGHAVAFHHLRGQGQAGWLVATTGSKAGYAVGSDPHRE